MQPAEIAIGVEGALRTPARVFAENRGGGVWGELGNLGDQLFVAQLLFMQW